MNTLPWATVKYATDLKLALPLLISLLVNSIIITLIAAEISKTNDADLLMIFIKTVLCFCRTENTKPYRNFSISRDADEKLQAIDFQRCQNLLNLNHRTAQ
ncbi:hypothetical protein T01_1054 [Trichinella spiralis]|uniref:Uncharacterized protein n=1 Tax=Trichinella spiralis TaxID=6334 RepID=A0A0V1BP04_TRISP|nr:hypothetical protein T01_1054 [Trichinella spiralis]